MPKDLSGFWSQNNSLRTLYGYMENSKISFKINWWGMGIV
jgi:hypothetical protein